MVLKQTPDNLFTGKNFIIHFKSAKYQSPELVMPLCVCFAISGPAKYKTESGEYSLSSFSWLFKQRLGFSPEAFRIMFKNQMRKLSISKK
jgi:hypothetical protein